MPSKSIHPFVAYLMGHTDPAKSPAEEIETLLEDPPTDNDDDNVASLVGFISGLIRLVLVWIQILINPLETRLTSLEQVTSGSQSSKAYHASSTTSQPTPHGPGRKTKCQKCHARGHSSQECRTANPSAVRRRIAQNAKTRAERRQMPSLMSSLSAHAPHTASPYIPASIHSSQVAYMAESAELRRRIAQSNRDRRKARRPAPPSS